MRFRGAIETVNAAPVRVVIAIDDGTLVLEADGRELGAWPLEDIEAERLDSERFAITLGGQPLIFAADDPIPLAYDGLKAIEEARARRRRWFRRRRPVPPPLIIRTTDLETDETVEVALVEDPFSAPSATTGRAPETDPTDRSRPPAPEMPAPRPAADRPPERPQRPPIQIPRTRAARPTAADTAEARRPGTDIPAVAPPPPTEERRPAASTPRGPDRTEPETTPPSQPRGAQPPEVPTPSETPTEPPTPTTSGPPTRERTPVRPAPPEPERPAPRPSSDLPAATPPPRAAPAPTPEQLDDPYAGLAAAAARAKPSPTEPTKPAPDAGPPDPFRPPTAGAHRAEPRRIGLLERFRARREPVTEHVHTYSENRVAGGLLRRVCTECGHVSIDLTDD